MAIYKDPEFERLVALHKQLAELAISLRTIAESSGLTRQEIEQRMEHSMGHAAGLVVQQLLSGYVYEVPLEALATFVWACGYDLDVRLLGQGNRTQDE